jgi:hypothetical protein
MYVRRARSRTRLRSCDTGENPPQSAIFATVRRCGYKLATKLLQVAISDACYSNADLRPFSVRGYESIGWVMDNSLPRLRFGIVSAIGKTCHSWPRAIYLRGPGELPTIFRYGNALRVVGSAVPAWRC